MLMKSPFIGHWKAEVSYNTAILYTVEVKMEKLVKFGITGVLNTAIDYAVFAGAFTLLGWNIYVSQFFGYSAGLLNSYIINRSWTFRSKNKFFSAEFIKFITLGIIMLLLSMGIIHICSAVLALSPLLSKLITTGIVLLINFFISKLWVFK